MQRKGKTKNARERKVVFIKKFFVISFFKKGFKRLFIKTGFEVAERKTVILRNMQ